MFKSSRRNKAEGRADRIRGWLSETAGRLTGRSSQKLKGKATRKRGAVKTRKGHAKQAAGRRA
jgi:uncharacterized protein YjbJ (UPF0337 family)